MIRWALVGESGDSRRLKEHLGDQAEILTWKDVHTRDAIEADIAYGALVGVNDICRRFDIKSWLDYLPLRCQVYYSYWGSELFNVAYRFLPLGEVSRLVNDPYQNVLPEKFFIRPDSNNKCFTGMIADKEEIRILMRAVDPTTLCVVAPMKKVGVEYRCFMNRGKFVTGSSYQLLDDGNLSCSNIDHMGSLIEYAESFKPYPGLPDLYALDIVPSYDKYRLMELTCWSCAGLYDIDIQKYIEATEKEFYNESRVC